MTALVWDQVGERLYETGVDRGVLYLPGGSAVPWNGLISINEMVSREVKPYYIDGIKFLDHHVPGSYSAKLSAYTYPNEMNELVGTEEFAPGVFVHDQRVQPLFSLSYRTGMGNDVEGLGYGYKIHILYNLMAILSDTTLSTVGESVAPQAFEWSIYGTPSLLPGKRPTSHVSVDSSKVDATVLDTLEDQLYGTASTLPDLPSLTEFLALVSA